jgi:hypothetical protein
VGFVIFHVDPPSVADLGSEFEIQLRFRNAMKKLAPKVRLVATPNAGKRTQWEASRAKAEGLAKGFCDLIAIAPDAQIAFIELKAKTGRLSESQIDWLNFLHSSGFNCGCFNSVNSAILSIKSWGFPFLDRGK